MVMNTGGRRIGWSVCFAVAEQWLGGSWVDGRLFVCLSGYLRVGLFFLGLGLWINPLC
uniref:Uncharacterized protein n=1 Tax=Manihot esculenta TaxID=3983 RepID=A0A2C9VGH0_MANES